MLRMRINKRKADVVPSTSKKSGRTRKKAKSAFAPRVLGTQLVRRGNLISGIDPSNREALLTQLRTLLERYKGNGKVFDLIKRNIGYYSEVGPANMTDDVLSIMEAPWDIPPLALKGYQLLERTARISKLATFGNTGGGFNAILSAADLTPYTLGGFRIKKLTSWSASCNGITDTQFAGLQVAGSSSSDGTESLPTWVENWTRIGTGFAGVSVMWPLGDFLLFPQSSTTTIATHFTCAGGAQGVSGIPVVFDVVIECLI